MTLDQWLLKLDPSQATLSALIWVIVLFTLFFLWRSVWPWYTKEFFPTRAKREDEKQRADIEAEKQRQSTMLAVRDALVELKVLSAQTLRIIQEHDQPIRELVQKNGKDAA